MKSSIEAIVATRYLQFLSRLVLVVRCPGIGASDPTHGGIWPKAINGADSERFDSNELVCGSIADYLNRPEINRYKRSGEPRRLAMAPI